MTLTQLVTGIWLLLITLVMAFLGTGCFHVEPGHRGVVKDAETLAPLKDAVVLLDLDYTCYFPPNVGGPNPTDLAIEEALTDGNGIFSMPFRFYFLPPLACLTDKQAFYFRPGYFPSKASTAESIGLYRMDYYLNYLPYKYPRKYRLSSCLDKNSDHLRAALDKTMNMELVRIGQTGVFLKVEGRTFRRLHAIADGKPGFDLYPCFYPDGMTLYAYDDVSAKWHAFDGRGNPLALRAADYPQWNFMDSSRMWKYPVYATALSIFYPVDERGMGINESPDRILTDRDRGKFQYITPHEGNISALAGDQLDWVTIESNGSSLCHYGTPRVERIDHSAPPRRTDPYFLKCLNGEDSPSSKEDDTIKTSLFNHIAKTDRDGYLVVAKTSKFWHIYNLHGPRWWKDKNIALEEVISFPAEKEITAFATSHSPTSAGIYLYIAFKGEGIRKYHLQDIFNMKIQEDPSFHQNSRAANLPDVTSLTVGPTFDSLAVYAATGEDTIYRFSLEGIPDYKVK